MKAYLLKWKKDLMLVNADNEPNAVAIFAEYLYEKYSNVDGLEIKKIKSLTLIQETSK